MYLTARTIRHLIHDGVKVIDGEGKSSKKPLIENFDPDRLTQTIEGGAFDLSLESVYVYDFETAEYGPYINYPIEVDNDNKPGCPCIGRKTGSIPTLTQIPFNDSIWLPYGTTAMLKSKEIVNVGLNMICPIKSRSRLFRSFCQIICSDAHPNFQNHLYVMLNVLHPNGVKLEKGARFAFVRFAYTDSEESEFYDGVWQPGRNQVTTNGKIERGY